MANQLDFALVYVNATLMLVWSHQTSPVNPKDVTGPTFDTWFARGGDAMAIIKYNPEQKFYALVAWWVSNQGDITSQISPPLFSTLEEAQAEANRLIFHRVEAWQRLLDDDPT